MSIPLPPELFLAMQYIHDNHSLISPPIRSKLDFLALTLLLNHSNEPEKVEKLALILDDNPEETPQLRGLGIEIMVKIYIDTVDVLFPNAEIKLKSMTKNGNLFVRSQTLKVWGERSLSLNYGLHVLIIKKTSPRKPDKEIDLFTYSLHWLGEIKNRFCFSLETKTSKNHYKAFWIGLGDLETAREWYEAIRLSMSGCYVSSWIEQRNKMDRLKRELSPRSSEPKNVKTLKQTRLSEEKHERAPKIPLFHSQSAENSFIFDFSSSPDYRNPENSPTFKMLNELPSSSSFSYLLPPSFSSSIAPKPPPAPFLLLRFIKKRSFLPPSCLLLPPSLRPSSFQPAPLSSFPFSSHPPPSSSQSSSSPLSSPPPSSPSHSISPLSSSPPPPSCSASSFPPSSLPPPSILPSTSLLPILRKQIRRRKDRKKEEGVRRWQAEGGALKVSSSRMLSIGEDGIVYGGREEGVKREEEEEEEEDRRRINDYQSVFVLERKEMEDVTGWRKMFGSRKNRLYRCKKDGRFKWFLRFEENPRLIIDFFVNPKNMETLARNSLCYQTSIDSANLAKNILLFSVRPLSSSSLLSPSSLLPPSSSLFPPSFSSSSFLPPSSSFPPSSLLRRFFENENYFIIKDHPLSPPHSLLQLSSKPSSFPLSPSSLPTPPSSLPRTFIIDKKEGLVMIEMGGDAEWLPGRRGYKEIKSLIRKRKRIFKNLEFLDRRREEEEGGMREGGEGKEGEGVREGGGGSGGGEGRGRTRSEEGRRGIAPKEQVPKKKKPNNISPSKPKLQKQFTVQESFLNNEFEIEMPKNQGLISFFDHRLSSAIQPPPPHSSFLFPPPSIPERRWSIGGEKNDELRGLRRRKVLGRRGGGVRGGVSGGGMGGGRAMGGGEGMGGGGVKEGGKGGERSRGGGWEEEGFFIWKTDLVQRGGSLGLSTWKYLEWKSLYRTETLLGFIAKGMGKSFRWLKGLGGDFNQNLRSVLLFTLSLMKELVWVAKPLKCLEQETYGRREEKEEGRRKEEEGRREEEERMRKEEDVGRREGGEEKEGGRRVEEAGREEKRRREIEGIKKEEIYMERLEGKDEQVMIYVKARNYEMKMEFGSGCLIDKEEGGGQREEGGGKKDGGVGKKEGGGMRREEGGGHIKSLTFWLEGGRRQIKIKSMPIWYIVASGRDWREVQWSGNLKAYTEEDGLLMDLQFVENSLFGRISNESLNKREMGKVYGNWLGEVKVNGVSIRSREEGKNSKVRKIEGLNWAAGVGSSLFCRTQGEEENAVLIMGGLGERDSRRRQDVMLMREGRLREAREARERMEVREEVGRVRKGKGGWLN